MDLYGEVLGAVVVFVGVGGAGDGVWDGVG